MFFKIVLTVILTFLLHIGFAQINPKTNEIIEEKQLIETDKFSESDMLTEKYYPSPRDLNQDNIFEDTSIIIGSAGAGALIGYMAAGFYYSAKNSPNPGGTTDETPLMKGAIVGVLIGGTIGFIATRF